MAGFNYKKLSEGGQASDSFSTVDELLATKAQHATRLEEEELALSSARQEIYDRGYVDFNFFAGLAAPGVMKLLFPPFYLNLFLILTALNPDPEAILRFALGLPRGFAKTTFLKILTCWFIVYGRNDFILVIGATEPKALDFIADVDEMLGSPNMEAIYGAWSRTKLVDNAKRKVGFLNGKRIVLVPMGAMTSVRGLNIGHERPNMIICDDIQTREGAESEVQNAALLNWFTASLLKCLPPKGNNRIVVFLGNMYPGDCVLQMLKKNSEWVSLITGAILEDGESLWPELKSIKALFKEYLHDEQMGLSDVWFAEVQNDPLDEKTRLLARPIPDAFDFIIAQMVPDYCFLTVDPAGFRKKSDHNVIAVHKVYDGVPICTKLIGDRWNPAQTVKEILIAAITDNACLVAIESVGYQQSLLYWVGFFCQKLNIKDLHIVELAAANKTKLSRISDYIEELLSKSAGMSQSARTIFTYYANLYKIGKSTNRDDYLDAPAYQKQVMTVYSNLLTSRNRIGDSLADLPPVEEIDIGV